MKKIIIIVVFVLTHALALNATNKFTPPPSSITGGNAVCVGGQLTLSNATPSGVWSSSNTTIATITSAGILNGISPGTTTVSYTVSGVSATLAVTVNTTVLGFNTGFSTNNTTQCLSGNSFSFTNNSFSGIFSLGTSTSSKAYNYSNQNIVSGTGQAVLFRLYVYGGNTRNYRLLNFGINGTTAAGSISAAWPLTTSATPSAITGTGASSVTAQSETMGSGIHFITYNSSGLAVGPTYPTNVDYNTYIQFGVTPTTGNTLNISAINFTESQNNGSGSVKRVLMFSTDGVTFLPVPFSGSTQTGLSYSWDFGDGTSASTSNVSHSYTSGGVYTVSLTTSDGTNSLTSIKSVLVNDVPVVNDISGFNQFSNDSLLKLNDVSIGGIWASSDTFIAKVNSAGIVKSLKQGKCFISYELSNVCGTNKKYFRVNVPQMPLPNVTPPFLHIDSGRLSTTLNQRTSCATSICNMINNGGFESSTSCGLIDDILISSDCWSNYTGTPDLYERGCTGNSGTFNLGTSTFFSNPATDSHDPFNNNNHIIGLWRPRNFSYNGWEAVQTTLNNPLIPNQNYTLSFWAKINNSKFFDGNYSAPRQLQFCSWNTPLLPNTFPSSMLLPSNLTQLGRAVIYNSGNWVHYSFSFIFNGTTPENQFFLGTYEDVSFPYEDYIFIDDVELSMKDIVFNNVPPTLCVAASPTLLNLNQYLLSGTVTGGFFSCSTGGVNVRMNGSNPVLDANNNPIYDYTPPLGVNGPQSIEYTYTNNNGCIKTISSIIYVFRNIEIHKILEGHCASWESILEATGPQGTNYSWAPCLPLSPTCNDAILHTWPSNNTTYTVTGTNICGTSTQSVILNITPVNNNIVVTPINSTICQGSPIIITVSGSEVNTYSIESLGPDSDESFNGPSYTFYPSQTEQFLVSGSNDGTLDGFCGTNIVTLNVVVENAPPILNPITGSKSDICIGEVIKLSNTTNNGIWSTSDRTVADVDALGNVTGNGKGTATISYQVANTCGKSTETYTIIVGDCLPVCLTGIGITQLLNDISTQSSFTKSVYYVPRDISINANTDFINSEVVLGSQVKIHVKSGVILNIQGSHLYSCDEMWQGIEVEPGGVLNILGYTNSNTQNTVSSFIEDAIIAVKLGDYRTVVYNNHLTGTGNNFLTVNNTIFNRNNISIQIDGYSDNNLDKNYLDNNLFYPFNIQASLITCRNIPFTLGSLSWPTVSTVENAQYAITQVDKSLSSPFIDNNPNGTYNDDNDVLAFLKPPLSGKSHTGIVLNNIGYYDNGDPINGPYYGITIGGYVKEVDAYNGVPNTNFILFDNVDQGIYATNTNLKVVNCIFQKPYLKFGISGYGIYAENTSNLYASPWDGYYKLDVSQNEFTINPSSINNLNYPSRFFDHTDAIHTNNYFKHEILYAYIACKDHASYNYIYHTYPGGQTHIKTASRGEFGINLNSDRYDGWGVGLNTIYNVQKPIYINLDLNTTGVTYTNSNIGIGGNNIDVNLPTYTGTINSSTNYVSKAISVLANTNTPNQVDPENYVYCRNNTIHNVFNGIDFNGLSNKSIWCEGNSVNLITEQNNVEQFGIRLLGGSANNNSYFKNLIFTNTITGDYQTNNTGKETGIYISQNQGADLRCNTVSNLNKGIYFSGLCLRSYCLSNTFNSNNLYGLYMDNNAILGAQGTSGIPADNDWGSTPWAGEIVTANLTSPSNSPFYIRSNSLNYDPSNYSIGINTTTPYSNNINGGLVYVTNPLCNTEKVWCVGNDCDGNWRKAGSNHFKYDRAIPTLSDSIKNLIATYETIATAGIGIPTTDSIATMAVMQQQLYSSLLVDTIMLSNSTILQSFMQQGTSASSHWFNAFVGDLISKGDAQSAAIVLGMWEPDNKADSNSYQYYNWIAEIGLGNTLTAQDTANIYAMALSCPIMNGTVVYWARNLYNRITNQHIVFSNNCGNSNSVEERKKIPINKNITNDLQKDIKAYPNPTKGNINIELPTTGKWNISISDIEGRVLWQQKCNGCEGIIQHNLEGSKGMCFIKITNLLTGIQTIKKIILQ